MVIALAALVLALAPQDDCSAQMAVLREGIALYRRAAGAQLELDAAELARLAARACAQCQRCDAVDAVRYYTALPANALQQGLLDEERFAALRAEVVDAGRRGLAGTEWSVERERILLGLTELVERAQARPDYVPAAQAASLAARLRMQQIETGWLDSIDDGEALAEDVEQRLGLAQQLFQRAGLLTPRLEPWWVEARLAAWRGEAGEAEKLFRTCLERAEQLENRDYQEHALRGLAQLAREEGDWRAQERALARIASFRSPKQSWALACDWASQLLSRDRAREAIEFLERCVPTADGNAGDRAEWNLLLGGAHLRLFEFEAASEHLHRVAELGGGESAALALAQLALAEGRAGDVPRLLESPISWKTFSPRGQAQAHTLLGKLELQQGHVEAAVRELGAALSLAEQQEQRLALQNEALGPAGGSIARGRAASVMGEWLGLEAVALFAQALVSAGRSQEALRIVLEVHARDLRVGRDPMSELRALGGLEGPPWRITLEDARAWVACAELGLLTWVVGADTTVVMLAGVEADGTWSVEAEVIARGRESIAEGTRRLREAIAVDRAEWFARAAHGAWTELFPPALQSALAARLEQARSPTREARLLIVAHGPLEGLPIELMPLDARGTALEARCTPLVLPGIARARPQATLGSGAWQRWNLLGAPRDAKRQAGLPGAEQELRQLKKDRPQATLAMGEAFDRAALESALLSGHCLHLATHLVPGCGAARDHLEDARLVLDLEQELCVREVAELAPALPLVVLSMCASGDGEFVDGQGLQGLARALMQGGTRNVVATLWPVSDRAAAHFATAFHAELALGAAPSVATHRARAALERIGITLVDRSAFRFIGQD